jgi:hypothetical protein
MSWAQNVFRFVSAFWLKYASPWQTLSELTRAMGAETSLGNPILADLNSSCLIST